MKRMILISPPFVCTQMTARMRVVEELKAGAKLEEIEHDRIRLHDERVKDVEDKIAKQVSCP